MLNTVARRHDGTAPALRVVLLCSRRAPGLPELLTLMTRGAAWRLAAVITSDPECQDLPLLDRAGIPAVVHNIRAFYRARGGLLGDLGLRPEYDARTAELLGAFRPDLVVLCGYLHIVTAPLLAAYPGRIINIHDSDLALRDAEGRSKYRGLRSTRDAIFAGESETRSTVHVVTETVDVGPVILRSEAFPTHPLADDARRWGATDVLRAYAYAQREWMMRASWGRLLAQAIQRFARGEVRVEEACVA